MGVLSTRDPVAVLATTNGATLHYRALRLLLKTDNYALVFAAAFPLARLAAQARSSAFLHAADIFLLAFFTGFAAGAVPLIFAHLAI